MTLTTTGSPMSFDIITWVVNISPLVCMDPQCGYGQFLLVKEASRNRCDSVVADNGLGSTPTE